MEELEQEKMMEKNFSLCAAYAADDQYAKYLGISILSLFKANQDFDKIEVFILDCGITKENKERLEAIAREYSRLIYFKSMEGIVTNLELNMGARRISIASYARLFLASIIPEEYDRVLYLDCDTIVCDSIADFWGVNLKGFLVAGVQDTVDGFFLKKIGLTPEEHYVNAGIILINLAAWRKETLEAQFMEFIRKFQGNVPHHDQGVINGVCVGRKLLVSPRFNATSNIYSFSAKTILRIYGMTGFYTQKELDEAKVKPCILHFTTGLVGRPWEEHCTHPMQAEYHKAAKASPWEDSLLPDGRKLSVKLFSFLYRHFPKLLTETAYRLLSGLMHLME
jgi:lipopolysaccharide biosynthesis glycosyltransferase